MSSSATRSTKSGTTTSRSGMDDKGKKEYSPGLEGVVAGESALCEVDEGAAGLRYRGYAIGDLAEQATFEEVAYLLLFGKLPTRKELDDFTAQLHTQWPLPGPVEAFIGVVPPSAHPMRSEEHTSELQSQSNLVCRLLLEKKKKSTHW